MSHEDLIQRLSMWAEWNNENGKKHLAEIFKEGADALAECDRELLAAAATADNCEVLRAEVARLTKCLQLANEQLERLEREWYLRGDEVETMRAEQAALRAQKPVAWCVLAENGNCIIWSTIRCDVDAAAERYGRPVTPLYAAPVPATVPAGWNLVPVDPTPEMVAASERAYVQKELDMCSPTPTEFDEGGPAEAAYYAMLAAAPKPEGA